MESECGMIFWDNDGKIMGFFDNDGIFMEYQWEYHGDIMEHNNQTYLLIIKPGLLMFAGENVPLIVGFPSYKPQFTSGILKKATFEKTGG